MNKKEKLFETLKELSIKTNTIYHEPLYTVEQANKVCGDIKGGCKNLFLKDDKKNLWLVVALHDTKIALKDLSKQLNAPGLRFAQAEILLDILGLEPGSVTPFGVINDLENKVAVVLDSSILNYEFIAIHPLENDATTFIAPKDLERFISYCGNKLIVHKFNI